MSRYILIAGINGAGKTTLYNMLENDIKSMIRQEKAGITAEANIDQFISNRGDFCQETALCGENIIKNIVRAKEKGYFITMYYVGIEGVELAKERVHYRFQNGGHYVSDEVVECRWNETFFNLKNVLNYIDEIYFYDNTIRMRYFAKYEQRHLVKNVDTFPNWFKKEIIDNFGLG